MTEIEEINLSNNQLAFVHPHAFTELGMCSITESQISYLLIMLTPDDYLLLVYIGLNFETFMVENLIVIISNELSLEHNQKI